MTVHDFLYFDKQNEKKMFRSNKKRNIIFIVSVGAANPSCRTMLNLSNTLCPSYFVQLRIAKVKHSSA